MKDLIKLARPEQYIKNTFIFLPIFFTGEVANPELLFNAFIAFIAFSVTASAIYILNDYHDIEEDRLHPKKKNRPLASGSVSKTSAIIMLLVVFISGSAIMAWLSLNALAILVAYVAMNVAYSTHIKHIAILDVVVIATGFVLRLFVGSSVTGVPLSMWIVIMTFLLAMFLALAKRRDDVLVFLDTGEKARKVIDGYNLKLIDGAMMIMASVVIVAYILYTTSATIAQKFQSDYLYVTSLFVILGILRYMQIAFVDKNSGSPTRVVLTDRFIQLTIAAWLFAFAWIIYL